MTFYAIRRKQDGAFMPAGRGRGFTHDEPSLTQPPRLFRYRRAASRALACWLEGAWTQELVPCGRFGEDVREDLRIAPRSRLAEDMEVVAVTLTVKEDTK